MPATAAVTQALVDLATPAPAAPLMTVPEALPIAVPEAPATPARVDPDITAPEALLIAALEALFMTVLEVLLITVLEVPATPARAAMDYSVLAFAAAGRRTSSSRFL